MRFATDTGGTFTDLIVEDDNGDLRAYKSSTTPDDPISGVLDALSDAADDFNLSLSNFLKLGDSFIHGTTHAINAVVTGNTARTAFITTEGHRDILLMREGGRSGAFDHALAYPAPYVPRELSFEVSERIDAAGNVVKPLDKESASTMIEELASRDIEAVAVCLLWSIQNPAHELVVGKLLQSILPDVPYTLSHQLNPVIREYRRASSACIDASLKPLMTKYLGSLTDRLKDAGFDGRVLVLTSKGGMQDASTVTEAPIQILNSGPSMAPVAGKHYGQLEKNENARGDIIVADTGGTTYDVSLIRDGLIPLTHDMWIGAPFQGDLTGFPSVDVTSVGAGGGSIAWVDSGGVLHVGPQSAGSEPGPACYKRGGDRATVTDAAIVLGYINPDYFLGGRMPLDAKASETAIEADVATMLTCDVQEAAAAVISLATENMVQAIVEITINQGVDPRRSTLVGGGGAAGINSIFIARRLGCPELVIPEVGATLSASGAIMSDVIAEFRDTKFLSSDKFDQSVANRVLGDLEGQCQDFINDHRSGALGSKIEYSVEARYTNQVWTIDVPLRSSRFSEDFDIDQFIKDFHNSHRRIFAMSDPYSAVEIIGWTAKARCYAREKPVGRLRNHGEESASQKVRSAYFHGIGRIDTPVYTLERLRANKEYQGPAIVESPFTTIVADPNSTFRRTNAGSLVLNPGE